MKEFNCPLCAEKMALLMGWYCCRSENCVLEGVVFTGKEAEKLCAPRQPAPAALSATERRAAWVAFACDSAYCSQESSQAEHADRMLALYEARISEGKL